MNEHQTDRITLIYDDQKRLVWAAKGTWDKENALEECLGPACPIGTSSDHSAQAEARRSARHTMVAVYLGHTEVFHNLPESGHPDGVFSAIVLGPEDAAVVVQPGPEEDGTVLFSAVAGRGVGTDERHLMALGLSMITAVTGGQAEE